MLRRMLRAILLLTVLAALAVGALLALGRHGAQANPGPTITVNGYDDFNSRDGQMTLREAMLLASDGDLNLSVSVLSQAECIRVSSASWDPTLGCSSNDPPGAGSADTIVFDTSIFPPGSPGTIALASQLPFVLNDDTLDGSAAGVVVDGGHFLYCFIVYGSNITVKGLQIRNCGNGVSIVGNSNTIGGSTAADRNVISAGNSYGVAISAGGSGNTVKGNYIGTNAAGTAALPNGTGVLISQGAQNNTIGGSSAAERNIISGNGYNVVISDAGTDGNTVKGNYIGINAAGTAITPYTVQGVVIAAGAQNNTVGGSSAADRNVISGNGYNVVISGVGTNGNAVKGNYIGTDAAGTAALLNGRGVIIAGGAQNNTIGGNSAGERNVISGSNDLGVVITDAGTNGNTLKGNYIGTNATGTAAIPNNTGVLVAGAAQNNAIGGTAAGEGNLIAFNTGDGVRVSDAGTTGNTIRGNSIHSNGGKGIETINGGNLELAPPVITGFGSVMGTACANCTVDIYSDNEDEGRVYEGSTTADGAGDWTFDGSPEGPKVTATATDAAGNTSEFSVPMAVPAATPTPTPTPGATPTPTGATRTLQWGSGWNNTGWSGADGTAPQQAFACADGSYAAAYRYVAGGLERFFPDRLDISNMNPLAHFDAFLILITQPVTCVMPVAATSGSSRTLQWGMGWNNTGWSGADGTAPQQAFACADGSYAAAYRYVAGGLERYFPGRPDISNMAPLNKYDAFLILVSAPVSCAMPVGP